MLLFLYTCFALIACQPSPGVNACHEEPCTARPDATNGEPCVHDDAGEPDGGQPDAGEPDGGQPDAGEPDGGGTTPLVITTKPRNNEQGVSPLAPLGASFSRPMDVGSFNTKTFTVVRQEHTSLVQGRIESTNKSASFILPPHRPLALLETYVATLTRGIRDATGTPLAAEHKWSFTTRDGRWGIASPLARGAMQGVSTARVAMDENGSALAVWLQREGDRMDLWSNRYTRASGWGVPAPLETDDRWSASSPLVAMTPNGIGIALWLQFGNGVQRVWARGYGTGSGWSIAQPISSSLGDASDPTLALAPSGHATAVWTQFDEETSTTQVWAITFDPEHPEHGWSAAQRIEGAHGGESSSPHVAIDETGHSIATWVRYENGFFSVWVNHHDPHAGWGAPQALDTLNNGPATTPRVSIRQQAFVVWSEQEESRRAIRASRFVPTLGWSKAQTLDAGGENATQPQLALDEQGNALAIWTQPWMGRTAVWANRYIVGEGWGIALRISQEGAEDARCAELAVDARGHALAVWLQRDVSTYPSIWSSRHVSGQHWQAPSLIEDVQFGEASCPSVAVNGDGLGFAVWAQSTSTDFGIHSNRFE
jgi:hypothetical protein